MNLADYIEWLGIKAFAKRYGITERAALSWRYGARRPKPETAHKIVADGPVTWEGIYGAARKPRR